MSTKITSQVWALRGIPATTKFILVKLADNANDQGVCWPSVPKIAEECEVSERTVQGSIIWAENCNLISREMRDGKSTIYHITPADYSPPQDLRPADCAETPAVSAPPPPQIATHTPADCDIAYKEEPSIEEPSFEPRKNRQVALVVSDDVFERFWEAFPRQRRGSREKATKAWMKALKKTTGEKIYAAIIEYSSSRDVQNGYAKGAEAWLNDESWNNEPVSGTTAKLSNYERALLAGIGNSG